MHQYEHLCTLRYASSVTFVQLVHHKGFVKKMKILNFSPCCNFVAEGRYLITLRSP